MQTGLTSIPKPLWTKVPNVSKDRLKFYVNRDISSISVAFSTRKQFDWCKFLILKLREWKKFLEAIAKCIKVQTCPTSFRQVLTISETV